MSSWPVGGSVYGVFHLIAVVFAVYLAVKCNQRINVLAIIVAIFCPWIYIIYAVIRYRGFCGVIGN